MAKWHDIAAEVALRLVVALLYALLGILGDQALLDGQVGEQAQDAIAVVKSGS